ncbi:TIGR03643 family protein [Alteromonas sp. H39]|uniref:TIGR03643 family protein n=1 Tax=Alteromonas sp. H39 TaxID=3389876 RepID=UPI0039DF460C
MSKKAVANNLEEHETSRVIEMAWEDRTPFEAIETLFGLSEKQVIALMRSTLKPQAFRNWGARVNGRSTKHQALRPKGVTRGYCVSQYKPQGANK